MVRLVHEQSEADIRARKVGEALAELTAQLLRLSAGAGSVSRLVAALRALDETMAEAGGVSFSTKRACMTPCVLTGATCRISPWISTAKQRASFAMPCG